MPAFSRGELSFMHPFMDPQPVAAIQEAKSRETGTGLDEGPATKPIKHVFPLRSGRQATPLVL
jgi:hypothetical protein